MSVLQQIKSTYGYLDCNAVKKLCSLTPSNGSKKLIVYNTGLYEVCPDPSDPQKCKYVEDQYKTGIFIDKMTYYS